MSDRPLAPVADRASRVVERSLARHRAQYADEVQRLVDATLAVMQEQETADPTVSDILERAALSTSAFYRHFPTKEDLLVVLLEQAHELTAAHLEQRMGSEADPVRRIELWVRAVFDLVRTEESLRQNRALLLAHPRLLQAFPTEISSGFAHIAWPLQVAITDARRAADVDEGDPAIDARLALSQVFGLLVDAAALGDPPSAATVDATVAYTLRAVGVGEPVVVGAPVRRRRR
jgi:AcrR family transcriptional regulator